MTQVEEDDYLQAADTSTGFCTTCKDFTRDCTEPDAEDYKCPVCDLMTVVGAEQALIMGLIYF